MATTKEPVAPTKRPPGVPKTAAQSTQESKDLRELIKKLSEQNSPASSKEITAYAKQTLKLVSQSQKAESAAFRREATKALFDFRKFVENSEKVSEARRTKLITDIDSVSLDAKNATLMMLSIAKEQSKTIKETAKKEAIAEKIKAKQTASMLLEETSTKIKAAKMEEKAKSKALSEEQTNKFKAMKLELQTKNKQTVEENKLKLKAKKDELEGERLALAAKYDQIKIDLEDQKKKHKIENDAEVERIKQSRKDSATKVKELKEQLKARQEAKNNREDEEHNKRKEELKSRTAERFQKLRAIKDEHVARMKKLEEESKTENLVNKARIKGEIQDIEAKAKERSDRAKRDSDQLKGKVKDGIYEANPMIQATVELVSGIAGFFGKRNAEKKKQKDLNRLQHRNGNVARANPIQNSNQNTNSGNRNSSSQNSGDQDDSGGMFSGIFNAIGSIKTFFSTIGSGALRIGKLIGGAKAIPVIGTAIAVVTSIWRFIEGFNNASKLFGEKIEDDDYTKRIFSGFVNVFSSIIGMFDTVAGWLGFETDLKGMYEKAEVELFKKTSEIVKNIGDVVGGIFDSVLGAIRSLAGKISTVLGFVPGYGSTAKVLRAFADEGNAKKPVPVDAPSTADVIANKKNVVNDLQDQVDAKKTKSGNIQMVADNSIKTNTTTITTNPLSTRNNDRNAPGYIVNR